MAGSDDDDTKEIQPQDLDTRELAAAHASRRRRGVPLPIAVALFVVAFLIGHQSGRRPRPKAPDPTPQPPAPTAQVPPADAAIPPPAIREIVARGEPTRVVVRFVQPADPGSAGQPGHYAIDQGVTVRKARLDEDRRTVTLTTSELAEEKTYTLRIRGVRPVQRPLEARATFSYASNRRVADGLVMLYDFEEGNGTTVHDRCETGEPLHLTFEDNGRVRWLPGGIAIGEAAIISSAAGASKLYAACTATNAITIEAWLRNANLTQGGPARIVTVSRDPSRRLLTLGQHHAAYHVRFRTTATGANGDSPTLEAADCVTAELCHVVYTRDRAGVARFYLNGVQRATAPILGDLGNWEDGMRFALANELTLDRPWLGELHLVAIYARALPLADVLRNWKAGPGGKTPRPDAGD